MNREGWHSGNMLYDMEVIKRACDTTFYGPGWPEFKNSDIREIIKQIYGQEKPDVIYSYFYNNECIQDVYMRHYNISKSLKNFPMHLDKIKDIVKIFAISDFWHGKDQTLIQQSGFEYCFGCFIPPYSRPSDFFSFFSEDNKKQIKFLPLARCVDKDCYKNYSMNRKFDVISVGSMRESFYPLRLYMHNYLSQNSSKLKIVYTNFPHCGFNFCHSNFVRENYARRIAESKMLISCGGKYHLAMNKIFESMGCGTAYVGEKPFGEEQLHLKDDFNYIAVTRENFIDKIKFYLHNSNELERICRNAKETFNKYHHIDARASDFVKLLEIVFDRKI